MSGTMPPGGLGATQQQPQPQQQMPAMPALPAAGQMMQQPRPGEDHGAAEADNFDELAAAQLEEMPDGSLALVVTDPTDGAIAPHAHNDNVAELVGEDVLASLAEEVLEGVEVDDESAAEYRNTLKEGMKLLGLKVERLDKPFKGASGAVHPMLMISAVRWTATARAELLPPDGPVRSQTFGDVTPEVERRAQRKQGYLNYYLTTVDEGYYEDYDQGNLVLGLYGSIFRKAFRHPLTGQPRSRYTTPFSLTVSDDATDMQSAGRVTFKDTVPRAEMLRRMWAGYYRDLDLGDPSSDDERGGRAAEKSVEGTRAPSDPRFAEFDVYEVQAYLDVPVEGLQHLGRDGEPDGLPLPWIITIEVGTRRVLRLERDWQENDELFRRRELYAHYRFLPGLGFYGWGLIHLLASPTDTASVLWRQAINAVTLFSFPGGLRKKGSRPEDSKITVGPGEFKEIDTGGGDIQGAVMPMPYRDVPTSWANLLESVVSQGQMLGNTTELQVGDARQDAPVGTTIALIEQAMRPEAATLQRAHTAQRKELRMLARLFAEDTEAKYPYVLNGKKDVALAADFADADDIVPVSDPNVPTQTQRLARAQAKLQLATQSNGLMDVKAALEDMLHTLGCSDDEIKRLMPPQDQVQPADPVTEFSRILTGQKVAAGPQQSHQAHLMAHIGQLQIPNLPPPITQQLLAHCGEHLALLYAAEASAALGVPIMPGQPMPPQVEMQVSAAVAAVSDAILAKIAPIMGGAADGAKYAELQVKREELADKKEEREFKRGESDRKAETASRQDAMEAIRDQAEAERGAADRDMRTRELIANFLLEVMKQNGNQAKAEAALQKAGLDASKTELSALVSRHGLAQAEHGTHQALIGHANEREKTRQHELKVEASKVSASKPAAKPASQRKR